MAKKNSNVGYTVADRIKDYRGNWAVLEQLSQLLEKHDEEEMPYLYKAFREIARLERRVRTNLIAAPCDEREAFEKICALTFPVSTENKPDIEAEEIAAIIASVRPTQGAKVLGFRTAKQAGATA